VYPGTTDDVAGSAATSGGAAVYASDAGGAAYGAASGGAVVYAGIAVESTDSAAKPAAGARITV
jgi:hypothetical protein